MFEFKQLENFFRSKYKLQDGIKNEERLVGFELELPLVDKDTLAAASYEDVRHLFEELVNDGWESSVDNGTNQIVGVEKDQNSVGTDVGACTLEVGIKPTKTIDGSRQEFDRIINIIKPILAERNVIILGYGVQPVTKPNPSLVAPKGRYKFLELDSINRSRDQRDGLDLHFFATSAASQVHIDVGESEAIQLVSDMNLVSGFITALSANSSVREGQIDPKVKATREMFWDWGWTNRLNQIGIQRRFESFADYLNRLLDFRSFMVKRGDEFIGLDRKELFREYILGGKHMGRDVSGNEKEITPELKDLAVHSSFAWYAARLAPGYGTLEERIACSQPPDSSHSITAFTLGLICNGKELAEFIKQFDEDDLINFRFEACRHGLDAIISDQSVRPYLSELIEISRKGLNSRNYDEEEFLTPLIERLESKKLPADIAKELFEQGKTEFRDYFAY